MMGYNDYSTSVAVVAGQVASVDTVLKVGSNTGDIEVRSQPSGATIDLDGWKKGTTPETLDNVKAGSHQLTLTLTGYPDWKQTVTVNGGQITTVEAMMGTQSGTSGTAGTSSTASGTGGIAITSAPQGANVYLEGTYKGVTPLTLQDVPAGTHALLITMKGYDDQQRSITVTAGSVQPLSVEFSGGKKTPGLIALTGILALACLLVIRRVSKH
jgi:hypothetical protein